MYHVYQMNSVDEPCVHVAEFNTMEDVFEWLHNQPADHQGHYFVTRNGEVIGMEVPGVLRWCLVR